MPRKTAVLAIALLLSLTLVGCSRSRDALTIYSGRTQNLIGPLLERFNRETGIPVDVKYGDSAELALLLAEEGDRSPADVFMSQCPGATGFLAGKGLLGQLDQRLLDKVDQRFRNRAGRWVGVSARQRVLVYNSALVQERELPDSVLNLTDARFAGRVAIAPSNGSFQDFVTAMRQLDGDAVGALIIPSTVSVLAGSDKTDEAARFVEFLLAPEAQRYFSDQTFEYPLIPGVAAAKGLPPLGSVKSPSYDVDDLGGGLERTVELIRSSGFDGV